MKTFYSQKTYNDILGNCRDTIARSGCFLTSLCNLNLYLKFYKIVNPAELNDIFTTNDIWVQGCLISGPKIASFLKLEYQKKNSSDMLCIAETDHYKKVGVPQHFFLYDPEKKERVDPLDLTPQWEDNTYHIVSYRIFRLKEKPEPIIEKPPEIPSDIPSLEPPTIAPDAPQGDLSPSTPPEIHLSIWEILWQKLKELLGL